MTQRTAWAVIPLTPNGFAFYESMKRDDGRAEAVEVLRIDSTFSAIYFARGLPYKDQRSTDDIVSTQHKAGLK
jgi:hypothetical protein